MKPLICKDSSEFRGRELGGNTVGGTPRLVRYLLFLKSIK